jgi:hypothetical protein
MKYIKKTCEKCRFYFFDVHVTVHRDKFLIIKPTRCTNFSYLFWNEILHVSDSSSVNHQGFSLYTKQQWYTSHRFADSLRADLYDVYHFFVYNEKLLMMDTGTVRNT